MKRKYTKEQIKECLQYLQYCVGEGGIDESEALDIVERGDWGEVYNMMDQADSFADHDNSVANEGTE